MRQKIRFAVTMLAFGYALFFVGQAVANYFRWTKAGINVDWDVNGPQFIIALCIAIAALCGWLLGRRGKIASCAFAGVVLVEFYLWELSTQRVKINAGLTEIPGSWIGNIWAGAGYFEVVAFLATLYFLVSSLYSLWANIPREKASFETATEFNQQPARTPVSPPVH